MVKHKQLLATVLVVSLGLAASGGAAAQGMQQDNQGSGAGMMGGQGGNMMGGQGGYMMGGQGGMMGQQGMMHGQGQGQGQGHGMMGGQGHGMMGGGMMGPGMMGQQGMMSGMLNEQQQREMREMRQEYRSAHFQRMGEMMNLRDDMMELMQGERPDPEEVQALHGEMATLRGEMLADQVRMRNQMQDLLTDEQREQLRQRAPSGTSTP